MSARLDYSKLPGRKTGGEMEPEPPTLGDRIYMALAAGFVAGLLVGMLICG